MWRSHLVLCLALSLAAPAGAQPSDTIDLGEGVSLDLVPVRAGRFQMGSPSGEAGRGDDEALHAVTLSEDFWIARTPTTRGQFARFVADTGYRTEAEVGTSGGYGWDGRALVQRPDYSWRNPGFPQTDDDPVVILTFDDAQAFARWIADRTGRQVTLPTEAQFEFAARAGTSTPWPSAETAEAALARGWFQENAGGRTHPVGAKKSDHALGLVDMSGHVYQWCLDGYAPEFPRAETDPLAPPAERRVLRGGSWLKSVRKARSAARWRSTPGSRSAEVGFRIVAGPPPEAQATETAPAAPPADADPNPAPTGGMDGLVTREVPGGYGPILGQLAVIGALVAWAWRRRSGPRAVAREDGFSIASKAALGTPLRWSAQVRGERLTGVVELTGPSTFVYTGGRPSQISLSPVGPSPSSRSSRTGTSQASTVRSPLSRQPSPPRRPSTPPTFGGFPPAY